MLADLLIGSAWNLNSQLSRPNLRTLINDFITMLYDTLYRVWRVSGSTIFLRA